jgi:hypothetical protein
LKLNDMLSILGKVSISSLNVYIGVATSSRRRPGALPKASWLRTALLPYTDAPRQNPGLAA